MRARRGTIGRTLGGLASALLILGTGCRRAAPAASDPAHAAARPAAQPIPLRVDNHYRADVVILLLRGNVRTRLGMVVTAATGNFRVPASVVGDPGGFYLIADPVGGNPLRSERVVVHDGDRVTWSLESDLSRSSIGIY